MVLPGRDCVGTSDLRAAVLTWSTDIMNFAPADEPEYSSLHMQPICATSAVIPALSAVHWCLLLREHTTGRAVSLSCPFHSTQGGCSWPNVHAALIRLTLLLLVCQHVLDSGPISRMYCLLDFLASQPCKVLPGSDCLVQISLSSEDSCLDEERLLPETRVGLNIRRGLALR